MPSEAPKSPAQDPNAQTREALDLARTARRLAERAHNPVAAQSAQHFLQGVSDAYRNRNAAYLQQNLDALRLLVAELRARLPSA